MKTLPGDSLRIFPLVGRQMQRVGHEAQALIEREDEFPIWSVIGNDVHGKNRDEDAVPDLSQHDDRQSEFVGAP